MKILRILIISAAFAANLNAAIALDTTKYANNLILEVAQSEGCTDYLTAANSSTSIKEAAASTDGGGAPFTAFVSTNGTPISKEQVKFSVVMGKAMTTLQPGSKEDTANTKAGKLTIVSANQVQGDASTTSTISKGFKCKNGVVYIMDKPLTPSAGS